DGESDRSGVSVSDVGEGRSKRKQDNGQTNGVFHTNLSFTRVLRTLRNTLAGKRVGRDRDFRPVPSHNSCVCPRSPVHGWHLWAIHGPCTLRVRTRGFPPRTQSCLRSREQA